MREWELTKQVEANWIEDRPIIDENNNSLRYPAGQCQEGDWNQVYPRLKSQQQPIREEFYEA